MIPTLHTGNPQRLGATTLTILTLLSAMACTTESVPGRQRTAGAIPDRIVSITPSLTEIAFAVGAGDRVVGVSEYCDHPPQAQKRAKVGGTTSQTISTEVLVGLRPNLVLAGGWGQDDIVRTLRRLGIQVEVHHPGTINDILKTILAVGKAVGEPVAAQRLVTRLGERFRKIESQVDRLSSQKRPRVFYRLWDDPLLTVGGGAFISELITRAGGDNIFADLDEDFARVSLEEVVHRGPEVILVPHPHGGKIGVAELQMMPGWASIPALRRQGGFQKVNGNILSRPGPRVDKALVLVAEAIHGQPLEKAAEPGAAEGAKTRNQAW